MVKESWLFGGGVVIIMSTLLLAFTSRLHAPFRAYLHLLNVCVFRVTFHTSACYNKPVYSGQGYNCSDGGGFDQPCRSKSTTVTGLMARHSSSHTEELTHRMWRSPARFLMLYTPQRSWKCPNAWTLHHGSHAAAA